jgi:hypothetical protein
MSRIKDEHRKAIAVQWDAIAAWKAELEKRFPPEIRRKSIYDVPL